MATFHHMLMKSHLKLHKIIMNQACEHGMTAGQPKILEYLSEVEKSDQKTIAGHCEIEPATVGSILTRMEKNGLVLREREDGNRRSVFVKLTEKGRDAAYTTVELFAQAEQMALKGISEQDRIKLCEMLQKVYDNLRSSEDIQ